MHLRASRLTVLSVAACLVAGTSFGRENPEKSQWFASVVGARMVAPASEDVGSASTPGVSIGYGLTDTLSMEVSFLEWSAERGDASSRWVSGMWSFPRATPRFQPYLLLGVGTTSFEPDQGRGTDRNQVFAGLGAFGDLGSRVSWRADLRAVRTSGSSPLDPHAQVGLTYFLGDVSPYPQLDGDGDGVPDRRDKCPRTPRGTPVDRDGCPLRPPDEDNDGVDDANDTCPGTPPGVQVDRFGCPPDEGGDGEPDYSDECPGTARGARVDDAGCQIEPRVTVEFDFDIDTLRHDHAGQLEPLIRFLRHYPASNVVVEGHADDRGSTDYNQALSERRAESVRRFLTEQGGIEDGRVTVRAFGESRPLSGQPTEAGHQVNRRVETLADDAEEEE